MNADTARLTITIYETEDVMNDEALLRAVARMLKSSPGTDEVRLVVHDAEGQESEFDLPRANVTEDLAREIEMILRANKGSVKFTGLRMAGAA